MRAPTGPYAIRLREIPADGLHKSWDLTGAFAKKALSAMADLGDVKPEQATLTAEVDLQRTENQVYARGKLAGKVAVACSRCVKDANVPIDAAFEMSFLPRAEEEELAEKGEVELDP